MAEYINREAVCARCGAREINACSDECEVFSAPAADVVEVVHGRWVDNCCYNTCSVCGNSVHAWNDDGDLQEFNYCPNCGAKMDGDDNQ